MVKQELSERVLASLRKQRPSEGRLEVSDTKRPGLRFRMSSSGRDTWLFEKRVRDGKKRRHTLGTYPAVGLSEARSMALEIEAEASKGINRVAIAEAESNARAEAAASKKSIQEVIGIYDNLHLSNLRRGVERKRQLEQALENHLDRDIKELSRSDMQAAIDAKAQEGKLVFANRIKAALSAFTKWAWSRGYTEFDQGAGLLRAGKETARERTPSVSEVRAIYDATDELGMLWGPVFRLLILTGQRRSEILSLHWDQVDLNARAMTKPGSETKNGKPHVTHLSAPALQELTSLDGNSGLVFTTTETTPVSGVTKAKRRLDELLGDDFEHWRIHDLRTAMASALASANIPESVVDRILNHVAQGSAPSAVARVYNQADMLPQRAAALDRWAEMVTGEEAKVVAIGGSQ
ncbi:MAG: tyrosine-type recombinase/integrase [Pseudomonadota bacterium]